MLTAELEKSLKQEAQGLYHKGVELGDDDALRAAAENYRSLVQKQSGLRAQAPIERANTLNSLGNALAKLGERESGTARLEEAVVAYRAALTDRKGERAPLEGDETQDNLGYALLSLGERQSGTARLEEAVTAFRAALEEYTRARAAQMGLRPDESRHCAQIPWRTGERDGAAGGGRFRLSRGLAGKYPRARRSIGP
jgi:tetratricopeptide (TPR) repeat protein